MSPFVELLCPAGGSIERVLTENPVTCFLDSRLDFLAELANKIIRNLDSRNHPDLMAFAYWCSRSNQGKIKEKWSVESRIGKGTVFHIAPSNVPINFAYTWAAGFITGNINIVRIPSKKFDQIEVLLRIMNELLGQSEHAHLQTSFALVRYPRDRQINDFFSANCDLRVIWGGDSTIAEIRQSTIPPKTVEITFSDRYSICVIDAEEYLGYGPKNQLAKAFFNDTYLMDQNACTSPNLIIWIGDPNSSKLAREEFWSSLESLVSLEYEIETISVINKLVNSFKYFANQNSGALITEIDNKLFRIEVAELTSDLEACKSTSGLFYEYVADGLADIVSIVNSKFQTLSYFGLDPYEIRKVVQDFGLRGIDRIVPIGKTLDFDLIWDGYELPVFLSRTISVLEV